ncbi:MAG: helicase-related protein [Pseudomonadota bacterium]|nr:helicase-related protein [Pseudomonadota bacterium]MEC8088736.1 helicase-related protein [Pseudomonadota bacterium]MEC8515720.1 helicase-related protein [Pseudomonadota bacterium]MEC9141715.1 helicase-related protein [Pseudomonadota bacterium]
MSSASQNRSLSGAPSSPSDDRRVTVVLGPTNTGKTHLALERMTGYGSGMIGFPLRLLARENYDRLVARLGASKVGLITGEERIVPPGASYLCCTVESMPLGGTVQADDGLRKSFDFVAVDEVQLAGDRERGHVFTDRILHARGIHETMFLGAETAGPLLRRMLPEARFESRRRLSTLSFAGSKKLTRLPRRSAIVAFGVAEIYQIAELVRRQRGGAAVVMGRLSPRTRNAQVELYQNGDVDFLVATDAIGMGLNLDLGHVALASDMKFDGRQMRRLTAAETAQIAGRAGRHTNDGTFGVTDGCPLPEPEMVEAVEQHRFEPIRSFWWRSRDIDFSGVDPLLASLEAPPPMSFLLRKGDAIDHRALANLAERPAIRERAVGAGQVRLLWDVACIPDFRQSLSDDHYDLLANLYGQLAEAGTLGNDMVARAMAQLDRLDGDIDTLMTRLAYIRTWTYVTHRADWTDNPAEWQDRARSIEDRLSDCLHERLSERFVDRRAAHLSRKLKETRNLMASVKSDGTVLVEGEEVGVLDGFVFRPTLGEGDEKATILAAARRGLPDEIETRVRAFVASATAAFKLNESGQISWRDSPVARLVRGDGIYAPRPELIASELLSIDQTQRMNTRLSEFVAAHVRDVLGRLVVLETPETAPLPERKPSRPRQPQPAKDVADAPSGPTKDEIAATPPAEQPDIVDVPEQAPEPLSGPARGLAFMMFEGLGTVPSMQAGQQLRGLSETDKPRLARLGLRFGVEAVYLPELLKPAQIELRALLWNLFHGDAGVFHAPPPAGRVTIDMVEGVPDEFWLAVGYRRLGDRVMRVDMVERVSLLVRNAAREGQFRISEEMLSLAGATRDQMAAMLLDMNCKIVSEEPDEDPEKPPIQVFERLRRQRPAGGGRRDRRPQEQNDRPRGRRNAQGQRNRGGRPGGNGTGRGQSQAAKSREPDPQSPFAVLAQLKQKS